MGEGEKEKQQGGEKDAQKQVRKEQLQEAIKKPQTQKDGF